MSLSSIRASRLKICLFIGIITKCRSFSCTSIIATKWWFRGEYKCSTIYNVYIFFKADLRRYRRVCRWAVVNCVKAASSVGGTAVVLRPNVGLSAAATNDYHTDAAAARIRLIDTNRGPAPMHGQLIELCASVWRLNAKWPRRDTCHIAFPSEMCPLFAQ